MECYHKDTISQIQNGGKLTGEPTQVLQQRDGVKTKAMPASIATTKKGLTIPSDNNKSSYIVGGEVLQLWETAQSIYYIKLHI